MSDTELNVSNKKSAGKGNGNTVINNHENVSNKKKGNSFSASHSQKPDEEETYEQK